MKYYKLNRDILLRYRSGEEVQLVKNEILTIKEVEKMGYFSDIIKKNSLIVQHSQRKIYWVFGARFQSNL